VDLVARHIPEPSFKTKTKAVEAALEYAREHGVTSVHDMASATDFLPSLEVYQELFQKRRLSARICMYLQIDQMEALDKIKRQAQLGPPWLSIGGLKGFADGTLGAGTAYFFEPILIIQLILACLLPMFQRHHGRKILRAMSKAPSGNPCHRG
jgi:predicted amidohydrolase YtcJ